MKEYKGLYRIKYNNKLFDIYIDKNHKKTFLEVRIENGVEKNYYPELQDYLYLNSMYNKEFNGMLHSKRYTFKEKVLIGGMAISIGILSTSLYENYSLKKDMAAWEQWADDIRATSIETDNYHQEGLEIDIYNVDALSEFGYEKVSFDEVRNTLDSNNNITGKYKDYVNEFINVLEERLPDIDLRVFNENLKGLKLEISDSSKLNENSADGCYDIYRNIIILRDSYNDETREKEVVFHELCHTLSNCHTTLKEYNSEYDTEITYYLDKLFVLKSNNYGDAFAEGFNTILTDYLLSGDWQNYFDNESRFYLSYPKVSYISYQLLKLLDNYTLYDYLNGNVTKLEKELTNYGCEDFIDLLDADINSSNITIIDNTNLQSLEKILLKERILDICKDDISDFNVYNTAFQLNLCIKDRLEVCNKLLNENNKDWLVRLQNKTDEENKVFIDSDGTIIKSSNDTKITIYQDDEILLNGNDNTIFIYKSEEDGNVVYKFGYIKGADLYDVLSGEKIDFSKINEMFRCKNVINNIIERCAGYDISINIDFLKSKEFNNYINQQENLEIATERNTENQGISK